MSFSLSLLPLPYIATAIYCHDSHIVTIACLLLAYCDYWLCIDPSSPTFKCNLITFSIISPTHPFSTPILRIYNFLKFRKKRPILWGKWVTSFNTLIFELHGLNNKGCMFSQQSISFRQCSKNTLL